MTETYTLTCTDESIIGRHGVGSSFLDVNDDELNLYASRHLSNPFEVVGRLAVFCGIVEAAYLNLLYTLFGVEDLSALESIFAKEGLIISRSAKTEHFTGKSCYSFLHMSPARYSRARKTINTTAAVNKNSTHSTRASALSGDVDVIPSPFQGELDRDFKFSSPFQSSKQDGHVGHHNEAALASFDGHGHLRDQSTSGPPKGRKERRLPHRGMIDEDGEKNKTIEQRLRLQFIGERMVSRQDLSFTYMLRKLHSYPECSIGVSVKSTSRIATGQVL